MKRFRTCTVALAVLLLVLAQGACVPEQPPDPLARADEARFITVYSQDHLTVLLDTYTGREYLWARVFYAGGLTLMPETSIAIDWTEAQ